MSQDLAAAIANAYRAFARYRLKGAISVCKCPVCVDAETERMLCKVPLQQMSSQLLSEYTHSAHGWDDRIADEFRYFLPRYFELIAAKDPPTNISMETSLERLHEANYRANWPVLEIDAVDRYFRALFEVRLTEPIDIDPGDMPCLKTDALEETLCMVAHAGGDIANLLTTWEADRGGTATLHIANIVSNADWHKMRLGNSWWYGVPRPHTAEAMRLVTAWLLRRETRERLEAACLDEKDPATAALLSYAEGLVGGMI